MSKHITLPTIADVWAAGERVYEIVDETPILSADHLASMVGAHYVGLKLELLQPTGSFKVRGATNTILSLSDEEREKGVITFSTGNHGRAVSYVAHQVGIDAYVCLSNRVPQYRVDAVKQLGGTPVIYGNSQDEAEDRYAELKESEGYIPVVPFDDPRVIAGQGTIALEILGQNPDVDTMLVPLSGGGLLAGIAMTMKSLKPSVKIVGVSISRSPAMVESLKIGKPADIKEQDTLADSLLGGIGRENFYTMALIEKYVDDHILIDEDEIEVAMRYLFSHHGLVAEGSAAVGVAALLHNKYNVQGKHVVMPLTGQNVDEALYLSVIQKGVHS
ncbi:MAG: pyridoxal-phosphate dependent enzyme [Sphaerochaetaceae bacterium]|jgi:threonine dehydratase